MSIHAKQPKSRSLRSVFNGAGDRKRGEGSRRGSRSWAPEVNTMFYFSELHVQLVARGILNPGEQLVGQTSTFYMPWWAMGFINRRHLVLATNQRLIVVEHRWG